MRATWKRILAVAALALGLAALGVPNASASEPISVNVVGTATLSDGLFYPGVGPAKTVDILDISSTSCAGAHGTATDDACSFDGGVDFGTSFVDGNCGLSTGEVHGTITIDGVELSFWLEWTTSAGGTLVLTGTIDGHQAEGEVTAVPTTGSCTDGTATGFTFEGNVVATP